MKDRKTQGNMANPKITNSTMTDIKKSEVGEIPKNVKE